MGPNLLRNAPHARLARQMSQTLASHQSAARVGRRPRASQKLASYDERLNRSRLTSLLLLMMLSTLVMGACGPSANSRLVITQSTDAPSGPDHKGHLSPGSFTGITLSIRNTGAGPARGLTVEDLLPAGLSASECRPRSSPAIMSTRSS
ncbi:MAG: DUF11 domain-containing protein [Chloroflexi bacterium]|nr:MAG: DUF11 domain-containing protein [Chloroflexota bacterium]